MHNVSMDMEQWVRNLPGNPSLTSAARAAGIHKTTLIRQLEKDTLDAGHVIDLCRAHGKSPVDGLVETGYLTVEDLPDAAIIQALAKATNEQILN